MTDPADWGVWNWIAEHILAFVGGFAAAVTFLIRAIVSVTQVATRVDIALEKLERLEMGQHRTHREVSRVLGQLGMTPEASE